MLFQMTYQCTLSSLYTYNIVEDIQACVVPSLKKRSVVIGQTLSFCVHVKCHQVNEIQIARQMLHIVRILQSEP